MRVYDARTGKETLALTGPKAVRNPVFSPDGTRIAVWSSEGIRVFDAQTGRETLAFNEPTGLRNPVFSPDGTRIAASWRGGIRVFDARTGQEIIALKGQQEVGNPVFSPDGTRLVSPGPDWTTEVFDATTGQQTLTLKGSRGNQLLGFSPDGARMVVAYWGARLHQVEVRAFDAPKDIEAWQTQRRKALGDGVLPWHRCQAERHEKAGLWFAAVFHLNQLLLSEEAKDELCARRIRVLRDAVQREPKDGLAWGYLLFYSPEWQLFTAVGPRP